MKGTEGRVARGGMAEKVSCDTTGRCVLRIRIIAQSLGKDLQVDGWVADRLAHYQYGWSGLSTREEGREIKSEK